MDESIVDLIERGYIDEAWSLIVDSNYDVNIPRLISLSLAMAGYCANIHSLPVRRCKDYMDLAGALATIDVDIDDHILYAIRHNDIGMLEFLINRGYIDICDVVDMIEETEGNREIVDILSSSYDIDECYESE